MKFHCQYYFVPQKQLHSLNLNLSYQIRYNHKAYTRTLDECMTMQKIIFIEIGESHDHRYRFRIHILMITHIYTNYRWITCISFSPQNISNYSLYCYKHNTFLRTATARPPATFPDYFKFIEHFLKQMLHTFHLFKLLNDG